MNKLYDSESFIVNHLLPTTNEESSEPEQPVLLRHGFEIVDKRSGKEVYLDGSWAELFQLRLLEWQHHTPSEDEVEATLEQFSGLAQTPIGIH